MTSLDALLTALTPQEKWLRDIEHGWQAKRQ